MWVQGPSNGTLMYLRLATRECECYIRHSGSHGRENRRAGCSIMCLYKTIVHTSTYHARTSLPRIPNTSSHSHVIIREQDSVALSRPCESSY